MKSTVSCMRQPKSLSNCVRLLSFCILAISLYCLMNGRQVSMEPSNVGNLGAEGWCRLFIFEVDGMEDI